MFVVTWSVIDDDEEMLLDILGPFKTEKEACEWCDKIKDDPKFKEVYLHIMEIAEPL